MWYTWTIQYDKTIQIIETNIVVKYSYKIMEKLMVYQRHLILQLLLLLATLFRCTRPLMSQIVDLVCCCTQKTTFWISTSILSWVALSQWGNRRLSGTNSFSNSDQTPAKLHHTGNVNTWNLPFWYIINY